jgi:hypothetical protein
VRELAVEQALERDVVLRFLLDTFPDGTPCITPAALFDKFKAWCAAEQHQPRSGTWFGREVKKVPAVECQRTGAARGYRIAPMRDFDTAAHLGVADPQGDGFDPTRHEPVTDRSPQEPIPSLASDPLVTGMTGLITEKGRPEKEGEKGIGKGAVSSSMRANPSHAPQPVTPNLKPAAAQGVSGNGLSDRSKFQTRHPSPIAVDGQPGWTLPGVLPKGDAPSVNVTVIDPQGKSHLIRRSRITPLPASLCA